MRGGGGVRERGLWRVERGGGRREEGRGERMDIIHRERKVKKRECRGAERDVHVKQRGREGRAEVQCTWKSKNINSAICEYILD